MSTIALVAGLLLPGGDSGGTSPRLQDSIDRRFRNVIDGHFADLLPADRRAYYAKRMAVIIRGTKDKEWREALLAGLPTLVEYHREILPRNEWWVGKAAGIPAFHPKDLLTKGAEHELSYAVARVLNTSTRDMSKETEMRVHAQIDRIMKEGARLVTLHLGLAEHFKEQFEKLAGAWKNSWREPFSTCLSRPLTEEELERVLSGMKTAALDAKHKPNPRGKLPLVWPAVREAAYGATRICFMEYLPYQNKTDAWRKEYEARRDKWLIDHGVKITKKRKK